jgi:hypothetical protein
MTAPIPLQGTGNPYTGMYMARQFDAWVAGGQKPYSAQTVFDQMVFPSTAGAAADASPSELFKENPYDATRNPTGNPPDQHSSSFMTSTTLTNPYMFPAGQPGGPA